MPTLRLLFLAAPRCQLCLGPPGNSSRATGPEGHGPTSEVGSELLNGTLKSRQRETVKDCSKSQSVESLGGLPPFAVSPARAQGGGRKPGHRVGSVRSTGSRPRIRQGLLRMACVRGAGRGPRSSADSSPDVTAPRPTTLPLAAPLGRLSALGAPEPGEGRKGPGRSRERGRRPRLPVRPRAGFRSHPRPGLHGPLGPNVPHAGPGARRTARGPAALGSPEAAARPAPQGAYLLRAASRPRRGLLGPAAPRLPQGLSRGLARPPGSRARRAAAATAPPPPGGGRRRLGGPEPPPGRKRPPRHLLLCAADPAPPSRCLRPLPPETHSYPAASAAPEARRRRRRRWRRQEDRGPGQRSWQSGAGAGLGEPRGAGRGGGLGRAFAVPQFLFMPGDGGVGVAPKLCAAPASRNTLP